MPIEFHVDHERRLVRARALGLITADTLFDYQQKVWNDPTLAGYDELVDMSGVEQVDASSPSNVSALAGFSARMDGHINSSKFAIVAPDDLTYGLGRMYQAYREMKPGSTKEVAVFRSMSDALAWLGHHL